MASTFLSATDGRSLGYPIMLALFQKIPAFHMCRWGCRWTAAWLCILWLGVSPALAYVPEGPQILELMVKKLAGAKTLLVEQKVTIDDADFSGKVIELGETLRFILPGQVRSVIRHEDGSRIHVRNQERNLTIVDEKIVDQSAVRFDLYQDLFLYNSRHELHKMLLIHGVDVGITSLGMMEDRVVYVIGAVYPDDAVSQLWVDKDRLLPLRWINVVSSGDGTTASERLEFVFRNWQDVGGTWYPMAIETSLNGKTIRRIGVTQVKVNADIEGELLNIDHLKTVYEEKKPAVPDNGIPDADAGVDEVQKTLEDFRKKFEP
jgi:hypothetical protein